MPHSNIGYLLAFIGLINPVAMHAFNPAMPDVVRLFDSDVATVQLSFTLYLATIALTQLLGGSLADQLGRRRLMMLGLGVHLLGTLIAMLANSVEQIIVGRVLQALGGGFTLLLVRTMALDLFTGLEAGQKLSLISMAVAVGQSISPTIGGYLNHYFGWSSVFAFSLAVAGVITWTAWRHLPETHSDKQGALGPLDTLRHYAGLLRQRRFVAYMFSSVLAAAAYFGFAAAMPYVVDGELGGNSAIYGQWFLWLSVGFFLGSYSVTRVPQGLELSRLPLVGLLLGVSGAGCMLLGLALFGPGYALLFIPMSLLTFGRGLIQGPVQALAVQGTSEARSTAVGLMGFIQIMAAAGSSLLAPLLLELGVMAVVGFILACALAGLGCFAMARCCE